MKHPALKREVSINKMLSQRNPRLRRTDVVSNSFSGCVSDAAEELSRAPEMPLSKIVSQPGMLLQQTEGAVALEKLKGFANAHRRGKFDEQVDVVNSDVKLVDFAMLPVSDFSDEVFTIHPNSVKLHRVHRILAFPHKVESILSKAMLSRFQIHFSSPKIAHANFDLVSRGLESNPSLLRIHKQLNFEGGNSSIGLKPEVSLPRM